MLSGILLTALVLLIVAIVIAVKKAAVPAEKEVINLGCVDFPYVDFDQAVEKAATIVYGKVEKKGEMRGSRAIEYETDVTVKVLEWIKGDTQSRKINFLEMGGETKTAIYRWDTITPVQVGATYIFFLNEYGACLSPSTVIPVIDGKITAWAMLPETGQGDETGEISLEAYLEALREACP